MVRRFTQASSEFITLGIGNCNINCGGITLACIAKKNSNGSWETPIAAGTSANLNRFILQFTDVDTLLIGAANGVDSGSGISVNTSDGWALYAASKGSGSVQARFHKYIFSTRTWTHSTAGASFADGSTPGSDGHIYLGKNDEFGEHSNADLAVAGVWASELSDAQIELLVESINNWTILNARGLWILNQATVATNLYDFTGSGANQTAITGTSVVDVVVPFRKLSNSSPLRPRVFAPGLAR